MELDDTMASGPRVTRIRKFNVVQSALTYALVVALMVFFMFLIMMLFGGLFSGLAGEMFKGVPGMESIAAGVGGMAVMLFLAPVFYFIIMFLVSLVGFSIYNLAAKWTGGIEITVNP